MQSLMKTFTLSLMFAGLTACGGGGGGGSSKPDSNPIPSSAKSSEASSSAPASSTPSSSAPASSTPASSMAPSSSSASSLAEGSEMTQAATNVNGYTIAKIDNCGVNVSAANKTFSIFADYDGGIQNQSLSSLSFYNWNHVGTVNSTPIPNEWDNISQNASAYNIPVNAAVTNGCNGVDTINSILVKKIANWHRQHATGFGRTITSFGHKFGDIKELVVDLRVNSEKTKVHTPASLKSIYSTYLTNLAFIDNNEGGKVNVGLTLETSNNQRATVTVEIDQDIYADQWVRVTVPATSFKYFQGDVAKEASSFANLVINNLLVVGETRTNAVLRGQVSGWTDTSPNPPPETFKEMNFTFKKFEFQLK